MIRACNIENYSTFWNDGWLFRYFEHTGDDFESDKAKMAAHAKSQEWWAVLGPMQGTLETRRSGEWWAETEEVFHSHLKFQR